MNEEVTVPDKPTPDSRKIGKYELAQLVGEGAMGKVYRAHDPVLSRVVAIKLMTASIAQDVHLRDRFLREARAAANLQHPNIITIYDFGDSEGHPYIAMEFVEGTDLAHLIQEREPLSLEHKVGHVIGLLNGLAYAHQKGVVHRDVKPANVRVTPEGQVKIMDFGIAHLAGSEMTHSGVVLGTPDYMAPEQVRGLPVTAQTDIFAAGAVLYELLTYEKPFGGETLHAVLFKVVTEDPPAITKLNPSLPEALERIVDTALQKEIHKRYPTADSMAADLSSVRKHLTELETRATLRFSRPLLANDLLPWYHRKRVQLAGVGAGGLALLTLVALLIGGGEQGPVEVMARPLVVSDTARPGATAVAVEPPAPAPRVTTPARTGRTPPRRPPAPPPAATDPRPAIIREVERLERAIASTQVARIREVYPAISSAAANGWEQYFRGKSRFTAELRAVDIALRGSAAEVTIDARFTYVNPRDNREAAVTETYLGSLEQAGSGWIWKNLVRR